MFTELEALARQETLLITVSAESGGRLRVGVTSAPKDSKTAPSLSPISLVATAAELDAGLAEALTIWQAPTLSLAEQARAAVGDSDKGKAAPGGDGAPAAAKRKPGPKPKAPPATPTAGGDNAALADALESAANGLAGADGGAAEQDAADVDGAAEKPAGQEQAPTAPTSSEVVDTFTLEMF
ncbi:PRTRC system protein E [Rugamonas sp. DEMB1]|uniref:PRTRC system protein E n=1 Tax=Rugamonas sp. DEMB1 TaxID=3039386 RepID=UPI00244A42F1|nr:PRTRC system protein E [Rugamonas sp. DEMB1]WGG51798.1 PRTRC system protein E [Rugamonas sp. DEMB1]